MKHDPSAITFFPQVKAALECRPRHGSSTHILFGCLALRWVLGAYQRALRTLFDNAQCKRVHAHLFRHTFATELLSNGVALETVSKLLGHSSTEITERHYSHWIKSRQDKLEEAVKNSWAHLAPLAPASSQESSKSQ